MTPAEIDRKLALAIGYGPEDIGEVCGMCSVVRHESRFLRKQLVFSHQDPTVILPIMERYDCAPYAVRNEWATYLGAHPSNTNCRHTNPRTAAALAVIKAKEMGLI